LLLLLLLLLLPLQVLLPSSTRFLLLLLLRLRWCVQVLQLGCLPLWGPDPGCQVLIHLGTATAPKQLKLLCKCGSKRFFLEFRVCRCCRRTQRRVPSQSRQHQVLPRQVVQHGLPVAAMKEGKGKGWA
jgi:hypothetical protein